MARLRRFDLEELSARPGTYFNPETEILIVVDDSAHPGAQLADDIDDGDWILVGDEVPLDDAARDELLERLEVSAVRAGQTDEEDDEVVEDETSSSRTRIRTSTSARSRPAAACRRRAAARRAYPPSAGRARRPRARR